MTEAGRGGAGPCFPGPEGGTVCFGASGSVTQVSRGRQKRVAQGLASIAAADGTQAMGPSDVTVLGGFPVFTTGLATAPSKRAELPAAGQNAGRLLLAAGGHVVRLADIAGYEGQADPDGAGAETNPDSVALTSSGAVVVDAAGNCLVRIAPNGTVSTVAVFPGQLADAPPQLGLPPGAKIPAQAVPTSVVQGPDGAFYVSQLTGFPFPAGRASVFRVVPGQAPTVYATGFTTIGDLAFDRDGTLYVLEIAHNGLLSGDLTGALIRVGPGGSHHVVTTALTAPGGLAVSGGAAYISDCGVCPGAGRVIRLPL
ncbi:ScyD/ScyE family protein [Kibdelosporangium phytohabitans]|uniref:ScyD/ScyE family protein n=1 Tax=Kibdelosporangium phytohabitans TaxID=860235 RepID=UPI00147055EF|nr:ScyD/ScyE family protein [Kibdelosporangium phytohabitans]MBE1471864.1 sugar lactone lactonase YvrE [Kibdelosporangium phytohabitans]